MLVYALGCFWSWEYCSTWAFCPVAPALQPTNPHPSGVLTYLDIQIDQLSGHVAVP
jgi:hypothetical protein